MPFEDTTAIVTGGAMGLGLAITEALAARGTKVAIFDIDADEIDTQVDRLRREGAKVAGYVVDVSDRGAVEAAVAQVRADLGPVLILVNNAGIEQFGKFAEITDEQWDRVMAVNLRGPFICTQAVLPDMLDAQWGRIVNISSSSAQGGQSRMAAYVSSKAGLIGFTKSLALELGPKGITVNTIPPGMVVTPMLEKAIEEGRFTASLEHFAEDHTGAAGGPTRGHRQRGHLPVPGRILLHHRPSHPRQRRAPHMTGAERHTAAARTADGRRVGRRRVLRLRRATGTAGREGAAGRFRPCRRPAQVRHHRPTRTPPEDGPPVPHLQRLAAAARRITRAITRIGDPARRADPPLRVLLGRACQGRHRRGCVEDDIDRLAEGNAHSRGPTGWCSTPPTNC